MLKIIKTSLLLLLLFVSVIHAEFPSKPIKIVVYTGPGGLIDITARKFASIADKYVDATFVVENIPGAGGIVALKKVLHAPEDGYNLYACTKSNIAKFIAVGGREYVNALHWTAMLMADPECVITNKQNYIYEWSDIVENASKNSGDQIWVGPAAGGVDHVTAMKIWDEFGIEAKWIPYKSGGKAIAALFGEQGVAYVGNPRDALGNPDLYIAAVSSKQRLKAFPDTPTFAELGVPNLDNEYMWRGFALKAGTPQDIIDWYEDLFIKVTADPEWQEFWNRGGIEVEFIGGDEFAKIVSKDVETIEYYLTKSEIIATSCKARLAMIANGYPLLLFTNGLILIFMVFVIFTYRSFGIHIYRSKISHIIGRIMVIGFFLISSIILYLQTLTFPTNSEVGPAVVPRLWILIIIPLSLLLLFRTFKRQDKVEANGTRIDIVLIFIGFLVLYSIAMNFIGYFISTFLFIVAGILYLGYKNHKITLIVATSWILFSYIIFYKILFIPLPIGKIFLGVF